MEQSDDTPAGSCAVCATFRAAIDAAVDRNDGSAASDGRVLLRRHESAQHPHGEGVSG